MNARDFNRMTPLILSINSGYENIARLFIKSGCNLNAQDMWGQTALMLAAGGELAGLVKLLIQGGADSRLKAVHVLTALGFAKENGCAASQSRSALNSRLLLQKL